MCGRFTLRAPAHEVAEIFELPAVPDLVPRFNIAPTQAVAVVRLADAPPRRLDFLHWGLIPFWTDEPAIGNRLINARAESVASKPAFRQAFQRRRCLVVADGFYEWQQARGGKQPFYIRFQDHRPFGLAGLWERWQRADQTIESCTIITTEPNDVLRPIHDRMPVIIAPADYARWLDAGTRGGRELEDLLRPFPAALLESFPVSGLVNNPRHDVPECLQRA